MQGNPLSESSEMGSTHTGTHCRFPAISSELFGNPNGPFANGSVSLGFWDVRIATEWIGDNIAAFGGDHQVSLIASLLTTEWLQHQPCGGDLKAIIVVSILGFE